MDTLTSSERSARMALVKRKGNRSTELRLILAFRAIGIIGWRRNYPLTGKPDFVFPKERIAVFVDGCFWHQCPLHYRRPKSRRKFWDAKVASNTSRDATVNLVLQEAGWRVVRIWEHELTPRHAKELPSRLSILPTKASRRA